ncbi:MAG: hypothetical protein ACRD1W_13895, partial [Vicinamibacterales bacterium]
LSSFQRTKDFRAFRPENSPTDAPSKLLDFAPALFGGTFQTYDDVAFPVNQYFAFRRKSFGDLPGSTMLLTENIA